MPDANVFAPALRDKLIEPAAFTLPASASSSVTSAVVNLGDDAYKGRAIPEFQLTVPALSTTIVPDTRTVTYIIETSTTAIFTAVDQTLLSDVATGAASGGVVAYDERVRVPSNCAQYIRAKITFGASTTTGAAVSATFKPLF